MPEKQSQMRSSQKVKHKVAGSIPRFTVNNPAIVIVIVQCAYSVLVRSHCKVADLMIGTFAIFTSEI